MSKFAEQLLELPGQKVRFYLGGGSEGVVQGRVDTVEGNKIYIRQRGAIHGTIHTITINGDHVRFYEIDLIGTYEEDK